MRGRLALLLLAGLVAAVALVPAPAATAKKAKHCRGTQAYVGGAVHCLKPGTRCKPKLHAAYKPAGFRCVRRRIHHHRRHVLRRLGPRAARQGRVIALGPSGRPTFKQALWNFDTTVAPLPGVKTPKGAVGHEQSGTGAIKSLDAYSKRLTRGQRRVLRRILRPHGRPVLIGDGSTAHAAAPPSPLGDMPTIVAEARDKLAAQGVVFKHTIAVYFAPDHSATEYAHTEAQWIEKDGKYCAITFHPSGLGVNLATKRREALHELMHCAMAELAKNKAAWDAIPKFLDEGIPEWAAYRVDQDWSGSIGADDWWPTYLEQPYLPLFGREYDAMGWWSLVAHEGNNLFAQLPAFVRAGGSGSPQRVYNKALSIGGGGAIEGDWGPSLAGLPGIPRWRLDGPGQPDPDETNLGTVTDNSAPKVKAALKGGADEFKVDVQSEVVNVTGPKNGAGWFRDSDGEDHPLTGTVEHFCTEETCVCPDGSTLDYPSIPRGESHLGFAATGAAGGAGISGKSLEVACAKPAIFGITVTDADNNVLARFKSGTCRTRKGTFTASAKDGAWSLDVRIGAFTDYKQLYTLQFNATDPVFTIDGPGGPYSNRFGPPMPPPGGGAIAFNPRGTIMGLGFIDTFNADLSHDVLPVGRMTCRRPRN